VVSKTSGPIPVFPLACPSCYSISATLFFAVVSSNRITGTEVKNKRIARDKTQTLASPGTKANTVEPHSYIF